MPTSMPLCVFVRCLKYAQEFDQQHSAFNQLAWMLDHWSFDDRSATYPTCNRTVTRAEVISELKKGIIYIRQGGKK